MHILKEPGRAPEIRATRWLNTPTPLHMAQLRGRVVLVDFWDYTCVNCLHTLPYLKAWHERYHEAGLTIIGVHSPEFEFAKIENLVESAVHTLSLPYPIALDNEYQTWNAYANRYWPAKYLVDALGMVRAFHFGEGDYGEIEQFLQTLLHEIRPDLSFPKPVPPFRPLDDPTALCYHPSPEVYLGADLGSLGNPENAQPNQTVTYTLPPTQEPTLPYLGGAWKRTPEYVEHAGNTPGTLTLAYRAAEVNLVMNPAETDPAFLKISQDGLPLPQSAWGEDVTADAQGNAQVRIDRPGMYRLVKNPDFGAHLLTLTTQDPGLRLYAFTFISCVSSETALA